MTARALMLCGTASHVGKSLLAAALCRILRQDGVRVAPFKAQNMSNNAAVADGGEIGRAQALQARAAGLAPSVRFNPILLKPEGERHSQVVANGRVVGRMDVDAYHRYKETHGRDLVRAAYRALAEEADVVVIEGAGSPVEINLKAHDIANLWMAGVADAAVLLVGDIDRGGALAALAGTLVLMEPHERARVKGCVLNKFRGERRLLEPALDYLRTTWGLPALGVVPHLEHRLPEEDGVGVAGSGGHLAPEASVQVGVVRLPRIANFTDLDPLAAEPDVAVRYVDRPGQTAGLDLLVLPGTKATLADLAWLRARGLDAAVAAHARAGGQVVGICGGYQMLGTRIADPHGVEGGDGGRFADAAEGLGLLPVATRMAPEKRCAEVRYTPAPGAGLGEAPLNGYEIHMGSSAGSGEPLFADAPEGTGVRSGNVWGCYLHGLFENDAARAAVLAPARAKKGLNPPPPTAYGQALEGALDALADAVRKALDMEAVRALL